MTRTLEGLLSDSTEAALRGDTASSWRLINEYAVSFWLEGPEEVPESALGEYYLVRATTADLLGLVDEAVESFVMMRHWAKDRGDHTTAMVASANLAYQSLNHFGITPDVFTPLREPGMVLAELAQDMDDWRPAPDSPSLAEDPSTDWRTVSRHDATKLTLAATTAFTVASNLANDRPDTGSLPDPAELVEFFSAIVRRFGSARPKESDRIFWHAQKAWFDGRRAEARSLLEDIWNIGELSPIARFEYHDIRANFAVIEAAELQAHSTEQTWIDEWGELMERQLADCETEILDNWVVCHDLATEIGAELFAIKQTELASRVSLRRGDIQGAWGRVARLLDSLEGAPICPALLDLRECFSELCLHEGLLERAYEVARGVAEWSELTSDDERTLDAYSTAYTAALGLDATVDPADVSDVSDITDTMAEPEVQPGAGAGHPPHPGPEAEPRVEVTPEILDFLEEKIRQFSERCR